MTHDAPTTEPTATPVPTLRRRRQWLTVLLLLVIFVSGGLIGAGLTVLLKPEPESKRKGPPRSAAEIRDRRIDAIAKVVDLSAEQKEKVQRIVEEVWVVEFMAIMGEVRPRILRMYERLNEEMLGILNEKQKRKWTEYYNKRIALWSRSLPATQPTTQPTTHPGP